MCTRRSYTALLLVIALSLAASGLAGAEEVVELWRNPFGRPQAVAVSAADGSCWVSMGSSMTHVAADGSVIRQVGGVFADSIVVDPVDGSWWAASSTLGRVTHYSSDGEVLWSAEGFSTGCYVDIAVDPGNDSCWVAEGPPYREGGNGRLTRLTADGTILWSQESLVGPSYLTVAVNPLDHSCWLSDPGASRVAHVSVDGEELWSTTAYPAPIGVDVDPTDGSCWLIYRGPGGVAHLNADGHELSNTAIDGLTESLAADPSDGACLVGMGPNITVPGQVAHFSAEGVKEWSKEGFPYPAALAVDPEDGSCWVGDLRQARLVHLSATGEDLWAGAGYRGVGSLSVNPGDGSAWLADSWNQKLARVSSLGEEVWSAAYPATFVAAVPADGSCWFIGAEAQVVRLSAAGEEVWSGQPLGSLPGGSPDPLALPSLAVNPNDSSLWTAHPASDWLVHLASSGETLWSSQDLSPVRSVAVNAADGSCWVAEDQGIRHLSAGGEELLWLGDEPMLCSAMIAADPRDGSFWVGDCSAPSVSHVAADGSPLQEVPLPGVVVGIVANPRDGSCWVATSGRALVHLSPDGEVLWLGSSFLFLPQPANGLAINPTDGTVWIADGGSQLVRLGPHFYTAVAAPNPPTVTSGGTTSLATFAADNLGHGIASWSWSDGGAGGTFSPSPDVPNPTYTAPVNHRGADLLITLTVTVTTGDVPPLAASASTVLRVQPEYLLQISRQGSGFVKVDGEGVETTWSRYLDADEHVTLEAAPSYGWEFAGWWGDAESTGTQLALTMDRDYRLTAKFSLPAGTALFFPLDYPQEEIAGWSGWALPPGSGWEWAPPLAGGGQPIGEGGALLGADPGTSHSGGNIIGYVIGGNYQPGMSPQYLTTPPLDFRGRQNVSLHFWRWLAVDDQAYDTAAVEVNVGSGWQRVWTNPSGSAPVYPFDEAWTEVEYPLSQADGKANVQVRWQMGGSDAWSSPTEYGGWSLDDISFQCAADRYLLGEFLVPVSWIWEQSGTMGAAGSNTGESTWDDSFGLRARAEHTPTGAWGVDYVPFSSPDPIAPTDSWSCEAQLTAPPVSTIAYTAPVDPSAAGHDATLPCEWGVSQESTGFIHGDQPMAVPVTIGRFSDILPLMDGNWARFYVEELAGAVPEIVRGYGGGIYRPQEPVTRDQLAVYIARATDLDVSAGTGTVFRDVPIGWWAAGEIEACANAGLIAGFPDSSFHPTEPVTRAGMCKFIANGRAYVDPSFHIPTGVAEASFPDVPADHWAARWISACKQAGIVQGYPNGNYQPDDQVNRGQMAVFVWRAFLRDRESVVLLGGPTLSRYAPTVQRYAELRPEQLEAIVAATPVVLDTYVEMKGLGKRAAAAKRFLILGRGTACRTPTVMDTRHDQQEDFSAEGKTPA